MGRIHVKNEAEWHELRAQNVGASEVAALFDCHDYMTHFELWHQKAGTIPPDDLSENDRVFWGSTLEPAIADGVRKRMGWTVRKIRTYWEHPTVKGCAASLDYEIVSHERGPGILQIKTTDKFAFMDWEDGDPPMQYELQVQQEMAVSGRSWGALAVLVGGNDLQIFIRDRHDPMIEKIEAAVANFWESIRERKEPTPDFDRDLDVIKGLPGFELSKSVIDLSKDNAAHALCAEYMECNAAEKQAKDRKDAIKAELYYKIGDAEKGIVGDYTISAKMTPGKRIEAYDRKPYRNFRLTQKKPKAQKKDAA